MPFHVLPRWSGTRAPPFFCLRRKNSVKFNGLSSGNKPALPLFVGGCGTRRQMLVIIFPLDALRAHALVQRENQRCNCRGVVVAFHLRNPERACSAERLCVLACDAVALALTGVCHVQAAAPCDARGGRRWFNCTSATHFGSPSGSADIGPQQHRAAAAAVWVR